jgi:hypothetical protein
MGSRGFGRWVSWIVLVGALVAFILIFFRTDQINQLINDVLRLLRVMVHRLT